MVRFGLTAILAGTALLTACNGPSPETRREKALQKYPLDSAQLEVMDAFLEGLLGEGAGPPRGRTDEMAAACYAANVDMPSKFTRLHKAYVSDYVNIDKEYYEWFARNGVSEFDAHDIGDRVTAASKFCLRRG